VTSRASPVSEWDRRSHATGRWSRTELIVATVAFVFSALVIRLIPARRLQSDVPVSRGHWHDIADGLSFVRDSAEDHRAEASIADGQSFHPEIGRLAIPESEG